MSNQLGDYRGSAGRSQEDMQSHSSEDEGDARGAIDDDAEIGEICEIMERLQETAIVLACYI
jgi:hypothetical protein